MWEKAIVIGGGFAGKLAAKALSSYFQQVNILEADREYKDPVPRKRIPQSYQPHVLLKSGEEAIEKLFPQFTVELLEKGSIGSNFTRDLKWHHFDFWKDRFKGDLNMVQQSRPMLEWQLQKRIDKVSNITIRYETMVNQLIINRKENKILGVRIKSFKTGMEEELYADLVVDASGFGSKSIDWLKAYGLEVKEEKVWIQLFYATRLYRLKKQERLDWTNLLISPSFPENHNGAFIQTIEENRFSVTISGYANESAPQTNEEFIAYAQSLPVPDLINFLYKAEPISDIKIHKIPYQVRRRFDLAKQIPEGFLVIGDAHCRFDPLFGQGISVAALEALELQSFLQQTTRLDTGFTRRFHKKIAKLIATPWDMAITEAFRHPNIKGKNSILLQFKLWYTKRVYQASAHDPFIYTRLARVMNLIRTPLHLFHPKVVIPIVFGWKKKV
ncbi:NAD(P)/FAD-dependent oxidoreductase [Neobacillus cucumis]|uniref:NAD(P)/FAD-dependent oxidoreductase n=1 Tax=Neobacillus cucumis TaxID=1740721 RepID=UPI00285372ED|nr:glutamate synthase [Neobacillus cucumis]MDR4950453.1 glutamate synthase [Neobacillus cucumis]